MIRIELASYDPKASVPIKQLNGGVSQHKTKTFKKSPNTFLNIQDLDGKVLFTLQRFSLPWHPDRRSDSAGLHKDQQHVDPVIVCGSHLPGCETN